ncbi:MAG TPA: GNAT family N-acetyltransferase [Solirubrobacteraceae bacterium]|nr:GNAT family N-acetyltransferase [Solirubrobacteraceae bacterium]
MRARFSGTERFDPSRHDPSEFDCGNAVLDRWLVRYAGQSERRDAARTFVATSDGRRVSAYYTLIAGELQHRSATERVRKGLSRHFPVPVAVLARLAVDRQHQGEGIGAALLNDALWRIGLAAEQIAVRAVVVHAVDDTAAAFYERFGFRALAATPRTLMITLADLHAAGYQ